MSIFETLLGMPLFRGISKAKLEETVGNFKFEFKRFGPQDVVVKAGEQCRSLVFILSGSVRSTLRLHGGLEICYTLGANNVLCPEFLFGLDTTYPADIVAAEEVGTIEIDKLDLLKLIPTDSIFLLNAMNLLARKSQMIYDHSRTLIAPSAISRLKAIVDFFTVPASERIEIKHPEMPVFEALGVGEKEFFDYFKPLMEKGVIEFDGSSILISGRADFLRD